MDQQIKEFLILGWIKENGDGTLTLPEEPLFLRYHKFFKDLSQSVIDSYFIISLVMNEMLESTRTQERSELVNQIHISIQEIFN